MLSIDLWLWYINITIAILDIIHRLFFYLKLSSIDLSVPHRKHITSPQPAQQVNAIYRFVVMIYQYNYCNCVYYLSSCFLRLGDWILSPCSGGTDPVGPNT
jgi:hypothetical protein